jgi:predicted DNA-binding antitoxin AbrB/MazE fold protein
MKITIQLAICLLLLLQNCGVEPTDWDYQSGDNGKLVVESILTTEQKIQEVRLSLSRDDINGKPPPVTGAVVTVSNGQMDVPFWESPTEPGLYQSLQPGAVIPGVIYRLNVLWEGQAYEAENQLVHVLPIPEINFDRKSADSLSLANPPGVFSANEQAMYEFNIDWTELSGSDSSRAQQVFYVFQTLDVNGIFKPDAQTVYFPKGSKIIVRKYGLNEDFAEFLRTLAMEVEWQGGLFDEASSSLPTNVSNGAFGYFAVCAVRLDSLVAQ